MHRSMILVVLVMLFAPACLEDADTPDGLVAAVNACADQRKIDRCHDDAPYEVAYCYDDNEIGPQPFLSGGDHPYFDCAAPSEFNEIGPGPFYFRNYWCCGTRGCVPGSEVPCNCGGTVQGFAYCSGDGLNVDACICPDVSNNTPPPKG